MKCYKYIYNFYNYSHFYYVCILRIVCTDTWNNIFSVYNYSHLICIQPDKQLKSNLEFHYCGKGMCNSQSLHC